MKPYSLDAQNRENGNDSIPQFVIKTNLLYDATSTFNIGVEMPLAEKFTFDLSLNYNPWTFSNKKKFKHFLVQPEVRYWLDETFTDHFFGAHLLYMNYNFANLKYPFGLFDGLKQNRYEGDAYGVGISYGYQWRIHPRWMIEGTAGVGYIYTDYKKFLGHKCGKFLHDGYKHYFGPTKLGISILYIIK